VKFAQMKVGLSSHVQPTVFDRSKPNLVVNWSRYCRCAAKLLVGFGSPVGVGGGKLAVGGSKMLSNFYA
jgi:hypothetical protein